jgi:hypothetical protein
LEWTLTREPSNADREVKPEPAAYRLMYEYKGLSLTEEEYRQVILHEMPKIVVEMNDDLFVKYYSDDLPICKFFKSGSH